MSISTKATLRGDNSSLVGDLPGAFCYVETYPEKEEGPSGIQFQCPCGCGQNGYLPFQDGPYTITDGWVWDGNVDAPTLRPSVLQMNGCKWHGYLTAGVWIYC